MIIKSDSLAVLLENVRNLLILVSDVAQVQVITDTSADQDAQEKQAKEDQSPSNSSIVISRKIRFQEKNQAHTAVPFLLRDLPATGQQQCG
jgi:hypothetical protein